MPGWDPPRSGQVVLVVPGSMDTNLPPPGNREGRPRAAALLSKNELYRLLPVGTSENVSQDRFIRDGRHRERASLVSYLPREHGAWAMFVLALATGWGLRGGPDAAGLLLALGCLLVFLGQEGIARVGLQVGTVSVLSVAVASCVFGAWMEGPSALPGLGGAAASGGLALWLRDRERRGSKVRLFAWSAHLAASVAMAMPVGILGAAGGAESAVVATVGTACGFAAGVLVVRVRRGGGGEATLWIPLLPFVATALLLSASPPVWLAGLALPARWLWWRLRPSLGWIAVGWSEVVLGAWMAVFLVAG